jgi:serine/threonine protein kinase
VEPPTGPQYDLGDPLGEGGVAIVYKATDRGLDRTVAVKCLRDELARRVDVRERFFDEARILGSLEHPGAIPIHQAGRLPDGRLYYSMKKVAGRTLQEMLAERTPEQVKDRQKLLLHVDLFARVCETMAAAHAERVIHRDLKPDNIMVDDFGAVYVMDWGLAKRLDDEDSRETSKTRVGAVIGTPAYMSPEQASGESLHSDTQSDVFSLGVVLYEILTGKNPFGASSARHAMKGVLYHDPDAPGSVNPMVGRALSAICMKALAKDPYKRYADARELLDDIRRFRQFVPVLAVKPRLVERVYYWSKRRPVLAAVSATVASVALIIGLGLGLQTYLERVALKEAYAELNEALRDVDDLEAQLAECTSRLTDPSLTDRQRRVLVARSQVLKSLIEVERGSVIGAAWAVDELLDDSGRAEDLGRDDYIKLIRSAVDRKEWIEAYALLSYGLEQIREKDDYPLTPEELAEYEQLRKHVRAEIDKAGLGPALEGIRVSGRPEPE